MSRIFMWTPCLVMAGVGHLGSSAHMQQRLLGFPFHLSLENKCKVIVRVHLALCRKAKLLWTVKSLKG